MRLRRCLFHNFNTCFGLLLSGVLSVKIDPHLFKLTNMSKKNAKISIESLRVAADLAWSARTPRSVDVHNRYIFRLDCCGRWFDSRCGRFLFVVLGECGFDVPPDYVRYALLENDRFKAKYRVFGGQITLYINPII